MSGWGECERENPVSPEELFISHSVTLPPFHSIFSFPSSSHPRDSSLACSAIDIGGRAPSHYTSSFPLGATLFPPRPPTPLNSSVPLGPSVLVLSSLSVLPSFYRQVRNFPISLPPRVSPTPKSIRSCESYPASCLRNFRPPWPVLRNVNSSFSFLYTHA